MDRIRSSLFCRLKNGIRRRLPADQRLFDYKGAPLDIKITPKRHVFLVYSQAARNLSFHLQKYDFFQVEYPTPKNHLISVIPIVGSSSRLFVPK